MKITTATKKIFSCRNRLRAIAGGASAGKTIGILQNLIHFAQSDTAPTVTSIVSESFPHLEKGAIRDFKRILQETNYWNQNRWNESKHFYEFETGSIIEFFSVDDAAKVHGPRRDRLFVNEANHIPFDTYDHLELRTKECIFLDWNPTNEFWFYTEIEPFNKEKLDFLTLTYLDNEGLPVSEREALESRKNRLSWWNVYGLGKLGTVESRIYPDWEVIDGIPHEAKLELYGLDFGYSRDPSAAVAVYSYNGGYILDQILYATGLQGRQIADVFLNQEIRAPIIADSEDPRLIDELCSYGLTVIPTSKKKNSVQHGILTVQGERISATRHSYDLLKEERNYLFIELNGKITNDPEEGNDHCMDAVRYAFTALKSRRETVGTSYTPPWIRTRWSKKSYPHIHTP